MKLELPSGETQFKCDFCGTILIPQQHTRIHCVICTDYDLCAERHGEVRASGAHEDWHQHQVILPEQSGFPRASGGNGYQIRYAGRPNPFWNYMITEHKTASGLFSRLIDSVFSFIDFNFEPHRTGRLEPEKCSVVMDMLGYSNQDNIFMYLRTLGEQYGRGISWSDGEVAFVYCQYGWEHEHATRSFEQQRESIRPRPPQPFAGVTMGMPLLTRNGFRDMIVTDVLADPTGFCSRFNELLRKARGIDPDTLQPFPREDIPSISWPLDADPDAVRRVAEVQQARVRRLAAMAAMFGRMYETGDEYSPTGDWPL